MIDVNYTYYGDHFTICINIESLCCTPATNMLCVDYISILKKNHFAKLYDNIKEKDDKMKTSRYKD